MLHHAHTGAPVEAAAMEAALYAYKGRPKPIEAPKPAPKGEPKPEGGEKDAGKPDDPKKG